jgi:ferredoxin-fold anticodon binding domain-containing protein
MKSLLGQYIGKEVGVNFKEADKFHAATLLNVDDNYFTITIEKNNKIHYPMRSLFFVSESDAGFQTAGIFGSKKVNVVIQVSTPTKEGSDVGIGFGVVF